MPLSPLADSRFLSEAHLKKKKRLGSVEGKIELTRQSSPPPLILYFPFKQLLNFQVDVYPS